jgi:hypothetical protein
MSFHVEGLYWVEWGWDCISQFKQPRRKKERVELGREDNEERERFNN